MAWLWWIGGAALLGLLEIVSLDLVLIMFAGGALAGALVAALGGPVWLQVLVALVVAALLLFTLRPWLLRHLRSRVPLTETNVAAQVGRPALVVERVTGHGGLVKLSGEVWSARTEDDAPELAVGEEVRVVRIAGATAVVRGTRVEGPGAGTTPGSSAAA
ncbi:NfeD family protein [Cellulomonas sp. PhB143]|uniref:NfeD family protein n=1 Tax=Cellulomonas sp. PhB143 TaxID=2485186 RepID=UPI000F4A2E61|nr:NfeD family protein [Cellulomonas sp. PhB143]ROS74335.1 membrane protein implicated in regulation of membrane protease activity [Cellulomonas sp. PhB143]